MDIKIQSINIIKPSKSTPENLRHYKLSLLDQLAPSSFIDLIFYYKTNGQVNISDRSRQLVHSLSKTLSLYYPLAGRLTEDGLDVDCNDQGVKYLVTQVNTSLDDFLKLGPRIDHIDAKDQGIQDTTTWMVKVQVNVFACGALVIGVLALHKVTDGCNLVRFVNQWASISRADGSNITDGKFAPSFDKLDLLFQPMKVVSSAGHLSGLVDQEAMVVTKRFWFNGSSISKLRAKGGSANGQHTRVTLVAALIWKALIAVDKVKCGSLRNCLLAPAVSLRGKARSPVSEGSFGNVWTPYLIRFLQNETGSGFGDLVDLIEDTTRNVIMWVQKASGEEICEYAKASYALAYEELRHNKFCIFTSWCRFPIYEADFGWGKPYWVNIAGSSVEMVTLMDDKDGNGIEAWVSLNQKEMYVFERDEDILDFTS